MGTGPARDLDSRAIGSPTVLVCAGHDPSGGAGVDADRSAAEAADVGVCCVVTTVTDQDGRRVRGFAPVDPEQWLAEARAILAREHPAALKFGLLVGAPSLRAAADLARRARAADVPVVVDPVLAASGGERFVEVEDLDVLRDELLSAASVVTPNLPEAAELAGLSADALADPAGRLRAADALLALGAEAVVLKGGHGGEDPVRDLVAERGRPPRWIEHPRVPGGGIHGSGCRHATRLAAELARGAALPAAAATAGRWLAEQIAARG